MYGLCITYVICATLLGICFIIRESEQKEGR